MNKDSILRGKIWWTEKHGNYRGTDASIGAYAVPSSLLQGGLTAAGEWRSISILKRVNLNLLGAAATQWTFDASGNSPGPYYYAWPSSDSSLVALKRDRWCRKQHYEQDRCYYMLKGALKWYGWTDQDSAKGACQLIAALTDMIDRDQHETRYEAPDGSGVIGWGTERFPVINEIGSTITSGNIVYFRVELYNPTENIPWLPDNMEAVDLTDYKLRIRCGTESHDYSLPPLDRMGDTASAFNNAIGKCTRVPMSGTNLDENARYVHVKLDNEIKTDFTAAKLAEGVTVELIKNTPWGERVVDRAVKWNDDGTTEPMHLANWNDDNTGQPMSGTWTGIYRRVDPMNAKTVACSGRSQQGSIVHSTRTLNTSGVGKLGMENTGYTSSYFVDMMTSPAAYNANKIWERDVKIPDSDVPSIGWLGEAFIYTYMDPNQGPITAISTTGQTSTSSSATSANKIDFNAKLNLFKPFGDNRNLHILDIFTCWDPSNDGVDNDGDGTADEDDEVYVFGRMDVNHAKVSQINQIMGVRTSSTSKERYSNYAGGTSYYMTPYDVRGRANSDDVPSPSEPIWYTAEPGPAETLGDFLRVDRLSMLRGVGFNSTDLNYRTGGLSTGSWEGRDPNLLNGQSSSDDDKDGKVNEVDERDQLFTCFSNFFTTRNTVFTVEIIAELTEPPYYPGRAYPHKSYRVNSDGIHAQKHLLAIMDRSTALQVNSTTGQCDFTGPVRILAMRWAQLNK